MRIHFMRAIKEMTACKIRHACRKPHREKMKSVRRQGHGKRVFAAYTAGE